MKYKMSGTHDIDKEWVNKVKEKGVKSEFPIQVIQKPQVIFSYKEQL